MLQSSLSSSGVYFMQKIETKGKNINFQEISFMMWNINFFRTVICDGVPFNGDGVVYNLKNLGY